MLSSDQLNATDEQILSFMDEHGRVTPSWVAEETDNARAYVSQRLKRLKEHGHVEQPWRGLWDLVADPRDVSEDGQKEADLGAQTPGFEPEEPPSNRPESHDTTDIADLDFPQGRDRDECVAAIEAAREIVREEGSASMREIVREVMPKHPLGYDVPELESGERYRGAWWRRIVKPGLKASGDVEKPGAGQSNWRYVE